MSQQAFRKRREKYIKDLESQLEELDKKHKDFLRVSSRKVDSCLQVLTNEINALEALRDLLHREHVHPGQLNINSGWDKFCTGPECCIDERTAYQNHGFDSSVMEDNR
jgi:hypothetical protein